MLTRLRGFSFVNLFGGLIDGIKTVFSGLSDNIMVGLLQMVTRLIKLPIALATASLPQLVLQSFQGMTGGETFAKHSIQFSSLEKVGRLQPKTVVLKEEEKILKRPC